MRKLKLMKTLLVAAGLTMGASNAWAYTSALTTMTGRVGLADNSSAPFYYASKPVTLADGDSYVFTFVNHNAGSSSDQVYYNWIAECNDGTSYFDLRADGYYWFNGGNVNFKNASYSGKTSADISGTANIWQQAYNGVTVTMTVSRSGSTITVAHTATTNAVDAVASQTYSGTYTVTYDGSNTLSFYITNEKSYQNITKVVYTNASGVSTMYKTVDLSKFDANYSYSDGTASFQLSGSKWSKLDLSSYYSDITGIITNINIKFTENIGTGGRMCFGIFGSNKGSWGNGMPETANSVSTWGVCGSSNANRVYYSSKPSNVSTLTVGSSQAIEIDMDMVNKSFSFIQGSTTLVNNQPFIDTYITSPKYFAGHTWTNESNTTTLSNMTIEIVYRDASYFVDECKTYETSAAFTTYIDGLNAAGSLKTVEDVYAAYTRWQIDQAEENGSVDYTKLLYNADFSLGTKSGWTISGDANTGAASDDDKYGKIESNGNGGYQYYTGWNGRNVSQTISGLPAGVYRLTARVYSWAEGAPVRLFANGVLSDQEDGEDHTPSLDFTVTGEESSIKIGVGGVGGANENNNTDKTWGTWGYRIDYFTLTKVSVPVTVTSAGYATYVPSYDLDFSATSIEAYKVKVSTKGVATLTKVDNVPAGTPVLLYKAGGATEDIPVMTGAAIVTDNDLVAGTGVAVATTEGDYTNMILNNDETDGIGFYFAAGQTVAANRAYLHIATSLAPTAEARMAMVFADETQGISAVGASESKAEGYYNLSGQRVAQPTKGLYIVNGKKVIIK